jgi:phage/plasmid-like protein (TIGR03299 family)
MFSVGRAWHGLGPVLDANCDMKTAKEASGLGWLVGLRPVKLGLSDGSTVDVEEHFIVTRLSDEKALGIVGSDYTPIQNDEIFDLAEAILGEGHGHYHTAGSLRGGKIVWILCEMPGVINVRTVHGDDITKKYVLISSSHDGTRAMQAMFTAIRVVCMNTLSAARREATNIVTIHHTKSAQDRLKEAVRIMGAANKWFQAFEKEAMFLSEVEFTENKMSMLAEHMFPFNGDPTKIPTRTANSRELLVKLFSKGKGNHGETAWDALQACTEFADHHSDSRAKQGATDIEKKSTRFDSVLFGGKAKFKVKALDAVKRLAQGLGLLKSDDE